MKNKCVTDGCHEQQEYIIAFKEGDKAKYCEDCTNYFRFFDEKCGAYDIKSVKKLEIKKGQ